MLYENYRKKIIKVADILKTVRKFRVLIITFLIALLCVMAVLLGIQGVVFDMSTPPAVIVYGQPFEYEAGAVMGSVRYEYAEEGSDEWTAAQPVRAGSYKVRAVAKGAFGGDRYGAEHSFTIEPKPIDVTLAESSAVYGEQPLLTADLAFSDVIRCVAFSYDYSQAEADISEGTEIRVFDENGEDVTSSYTFRSVEGTLLIEQRAVAITTDSAEKVYDGTPLTDTGYTVSADTPLAENDSVYIDDEADLTVQATITAAGSVENSLAFFFKKSITVDGEELFVDVTSNYAQEITYGTLTVKKRPVTFETASQSWVYDGEAHSNGGHVIAEGEGEYGLLNGHMMAVDESTLPQATEAGEVQNAFTIRIESAGEDMTDNYDVTYSYGTLTIKPRPVIFVTEGHEWVYDGTAHSWGGYSVAESAEEEYGLVEGHASAAVGFTYVTNVADSGAANVLTVAVYDGERDVTGNYAISYDEENAGKLTIKPRSVTFVTEGHEWVYDGEAHSWGGHSVAQGSENGLAEGHTSEAVAFTCVTDVANSGTVNKLTVAVYDDAEDVTANYEIAYDADGAGILTVTPRAVVIATATDEKVYDGTPLENGGCFDSGKGTYELVEGHSPVWDGNGTLPSVTDVLYEDGKVVGMENAFAVRILDADGTDRTDNYAVGYDYGTLTVTPRPIKVRSDSAEKVYDAASLTAHGCEITEGTLAAEQTLTADYTGSVTNVWESAEENNLFTVTIRDAAENNVTANYAVTYEYGTLTITPRPIVVTAASGEKVYDAEPFGTDDFVGGEYYLVASDADPALAPPVVAGQTLAVETQLPESADVYERGEHTLTPEDVTVWAGGTDVTANYAIRTENGTVTIKPRTVTFVTESRSWVYDGEAHSWDRHAVAPTSEYGLVEGHTSRATELVYITDVLYGENGDVAGIPNALVIKVYDADGAPVAVGNYSILYECGTLTVTPRPIVVTAASGEKVYDGMPFGSDDFAGGEYYLVASGADPALEPPVAAGQTLEVGTQLPESADVYESGAHTVVSVKVWADGTEVTANYSIRTEDGAVMIAPRPITVTAGSADKVYDGTPLVCATYNVTSDIRLVEGHTLTAKTVGSRTDVGSSPNEIDEESVTIFSADGRDVRKNYDVTCEAGTLVVTPRAITIVTGSKTWVYDGNAHSWYEDEEGNPTYYLAEGSTLADGQSMRVEDFTEITDAGSVENALKIGIYDKEGVSRTSNYTIGYDKGTLTVTKRSVTIVTEGHEWVYDGETHSWDGHSVSEGSAYPLVSGHRTEVVSVTEITNVWESPVKNVLGIRIVDEDGNNVTQNYETDYEYGTLIITPRPIVVTAASGEKVYDGMPFGSDDFAGGEYYLVASGADPALEPPVAAGQTLEVGTQLPESADVYESGAHTVVSVKVWADGTEVTANYSIRTEDGAVMIAPRPITVTAGSADKVYDGTPLVCATYNVTSDIRLVEGHTLTARTVGSRTDVGSSPNEIDEESVTIVSADGTDVSRNYQITEESGMLTVLVPGVLVVRTGGAEKIFDGTALTNAEYTIESTLGENFGMQFTVEVSCTGSILHAGKTANTAEVRVEDSNGEDVTKYARIEYELGLLKIAPRPAKVVTGSAEWEYDGEPHSYPDETRIEAVEYDGVTYGLVQGHEAVFTDHAEIVMPGTMENDVTVTVTDGGTIDFTDDYEFEYELGTLEIIDSSGGDGGGGGAGDLDTSGELGGGALGGEGNATVLRVRADVSEYVYFRLLSFGNYNGGGWVYAPEYGQLLDGAYGMNYLTGIALSQAGYTSSQIAIEMKTHDYLLPYYMATGAGDYTVQTSDVWYKGDTSAAYSLPFYAYDYVRDGALTAGLGGYAAAEEAYRAFVYENYLTVRESARACMQAIIAEQGFRADDPAIVTKVAAYIQNAAAYNLEYDRAMDDEADVVVAFLTKYKEGICQHYASAATLLFRELGIPARYTVGYVGETVAGEWTEIGAANAHAWVEVYLDGVGWVHVEVTGGGPGGGGGGSGQQEELTIKPVNKTKKFDGKPLKADAVQGADEASALRLNELLTEGYTYKAEFAGSITEPGTTESTIENFVLYDPQGAEAENVTFTFEPGTLTVVSNILITIHPYVLQKYYDGTQLAYKADDYWVSGLQSGWRIEGFSMEGIGLTDVGAITADSDEILERLVGVRVYDESGILRTEGVDYTLVIDGSTLLTVDRRAITVSSYSDTKPYDGEPLTNKNCWISSGNLANGHIFEATVTGSITDVGTKQNTIEKVIIRDGDGNEVTKNYNIVFSPGWLTVLDG